MWVLSASSSFFLCGHLIEVEVEVAIEVKNSSKPYLTEC